MSNRGCLSGDPASAKSIDGLTQFGFSHLMLSLNVEERVFLPTMMAEILELDRIDDGTSTLDSFFLHPSA